MHPMRQHGADCKAYSQPGKGNIGACTITGPRATTERMMMTTNPSVDEYRPGQAEIAEAILANWPETEIREHDAGCFSALVESVLPDVQQIMGKYQGIAYGPDILGGCYINF
jgi:hypothetical protein